ncbi:MAG: BolA family transcriptional regulator [Pseudomonadota bacterium]
MPVEPGDIESRLRAAFPDATIEINDLAGDGNHYAARVISEQFRGKNRVQQTRMVNAALSDILKGADAPLHALAIETAIPD